MSRRRPAIFQCQDASEAFRYLRQYPMSYFLPALQAVNFFRRRADQRGWSGNAWGRRIAAYPQCILHLVRREERLPADRSDCRLLHNTEYEYPILLKVRDYMVR